MSVTKPRRTGLVNTFWRIYPPSLYRIEIEKSGFKKIIKPDVILHVQDAVKIDFEMAVGSVSEAMTVEAGAPPVNTESGTVSTVIDRTFVENLPLVSCFSSLQCFPSSAPS